MLPDELLVQARGFSDVIVALRRAIHADPEPGLHTLCARDKVRLALVHLPLGSAVLAGCAEYFLLEGFA